MENLGNFSSWTENSYENVSGIPQFQISLRKIWDMLKIVHNFPQHFLQLEKDVDHLH